MHLEKQHKFFIKKLDFISKSEILLIVLMCGKFTTITTPLIFQTKNVEKKGVLEHKSIGMATLKGNGV